MNPYADACDDFGLFAYINTKLDLPHHSETVLHFFEALRKQFPQMTEFSKRETGEFVLEEDRDAESYRWVSLEDRRMTSAYMNPPLLEDADFQHEKILEAAPYHLDLNGLNVDSLDVFTSFDFIFSGNHDQVIAEALGKDSPFDGFMNLDGARVIGYEPSILIALDEDCRLQARVGIESRTTPFQVQTGNFPESSLSVYLQVRQIWSKQPFKTFTESYRNQRRIASELIESFVLPNVVAPLAQRIAAK